MAHDIPGLTLEEGSGPKPQAGLARTIFKALKFALAAETAAAQNGFLQRRDPRIKIMALLTFILAASLSASLGILLALFCLAAALAVASRITPRHMMYQVWLPVLFFTGIIAIPAPFLVPGDVVAHFPLTGWPLSLQGLRSAAFLVLRGATAASFAVLLVLTTPWPHLLTALSSLGLPVMIVAMLNMTHRYIFVFLQTAANMFEAQHSRTMAPLSPAQRRRVALAGAGVLFSKSMSMAHDIHLAMIARGWRGEARLLHRFRITSADWLFLFATLCIAGLAVVFGR